VNQNSTAIVEISSARGVGSIFGGVCTTSGCQERPDLLIGRRGSIAAGHGRLADVPSTILVIDPLPTFFLVTMESLCDGFIWVTSSAAAIGALRTIRVAPRRWRRRSYLLTTLVMTSACSEPKNPDDKQYAFEP
jgi:hypothetical protein